MAKTKRTRRPRLEDLIPDEDRRKEVVRRLYSGDKLIGEDGIFTDLLQAMVNASLEGEMDDHLKEEKLQGNVNRRNGHTTKKVRSNGGPLEIHTPRDRNGDFSPQIINKWDRELNTGLNETIISLYARGQSVEDIRHTIREIYGVEVSAGVISAVTDRVMDELISWQQRPLCACYPIVYLDAIHFKVKHEGVFKSRAIYTCYGMDTEGKRDVLGLYVKESEGARQWGLVLEDLKKRGVEDIFIISIDGLTGFKDVIEEVFPHTIIQRCIVHMIRSSTRFVAEKKKRAVCADLRKVYGAENRLDAELAMEAFEAKWDKTYPEIGKKWRADWDDLMGFMDFKADLRRMMYTTNPVEAVHRIMRKTTKTKNAWTNEKALIKQVYLTLMHNEKSWRRTAFKWSHIQRDLIDTFGERYLKHIE